MLGKTSTKLFSPSAAPQQLLSPLSPEARGSAPNFRAGHSYTDSVILHYGPRSGRRFTPGKRDQVDVQLAHITQGILGTSPGMSGSRIVNQAPRS